MVYLGHGAPHGAQADDSSAGAARLSVIGLVKWSKVLRRNISKIKIKCIFLGELIIYIKIQKKV